MIVCQDAAVDLGDGQAPQVCRMHPIIDALGFIVRAGGDTGLKVNDSRNWCRSIDLPGRLAPYIREINGLTDRAVDPLGHRQIFKGGFHISFMKRRIRRTGKNLIDASSCHHIAA